MGTYIRTTFESFKEPIGQEILCYHGTASFLPFKKFSEKMVGTGNVSISRKNYGGFFFTTEHDNADWYTEWYILSVKIQNVVPDPYNDRNPPVTMQKAAGDKKNYLIEDIYDGGQHSDVIVVPSSNIQDINIVSYEFVGDIDTLHEKYDELFDSEGEGYISKDTIEDMFGMMDIDLGFMLTFPEFKQYYESK